MVRRSVCYFVMNTSHIHQNSLSCNKFWSLLGVAINKDRGKASSDSGLRSNMRRPRLSEAMLNKVTIRNLIRSAGTASSYWSPHIYDHVVRWEFSCVQENFQESTNTALPKEVIRAQEPKFSRLKNRNNLKTTGYNLFGGIRSIHSTLCIREGIQVNKLFYDSRRSFSKKILSKNLEERVTITEIRKQIKERKNKDGRYGNLIQIIGSPSTLHLAYLMIKSNSGISSKGIDNKTLDGISLNKLNKMSKDILSGHIKISPVRRILIVKPGKKELRPLGISNSCEKIVQKAIEIVLTAIFEDIFLDCSHGFRPGKSCHTALKYLQLNVGNASTYTWVVEGDIKGCFDNIPHKMIIKGIQRRIDCPSTIFLIKKILNAGYVLNDDLKRHGSNAKVVRSNIGTPQGIVLSPLFCNIVLHEMDTFIEKNLKSVYTKGKNRKANLEYRKLRYKIKNETDLKKRRKLINQCLKVPSKDFHDSNFKRLFYVRYADDWIILLAGSHTDAKNIHSEVSKALKNLGLTLNMDKTHITSLRKDNFNFLSVNIGIRKTTNEHYKPVRQVNKNGKIIRQRISPRLIYTAPIEKLLIKLKDRGFIKRNNKGELFPIGKSNCIPLTHPQILNYYNSKIRGILNYYSCVHNRNELWAIVRFLHYSCALTLARKHKLKTLKKTFKKFGRDLKFVNNKGKVYRLYRPENLRMLPMDKRFNAQMNEEIDQTLNQTWSNSLTRSQFDESCAICGTMENIEIHHIKSVKNVRVKVRTYAQWIGGFQRKTIPLCKEHHQLYHAGKLSQNDIETLSIYKGKKER